MRPPKVEEEALVNGLMSVLRDKGYDGASLNDLANASGLQKASLYHRFPGGKQEIAQTVLQYVQEWVRKFVYELLNNSTLPVPQRLGQVLGNLNELYEQGRKSCLLRALSMDGSIELFGLQIKQTMELWIQGFAQLGIDAGYDATLARQKALQVLVQVQGSLVVAKGLDSTTPFAEALLFIEQLYESA